MTMRGWVNRELPAQAIPDDVRGYAEGAATLAARLLGIPTPTVRYFTALPLRDALGEHAALIDRAGWAAGVRVGEVFLEEHALAGLARRAEAAVWVHAFLDSEQLVRVALHECRHRWQYAVGWLDGAHPRAAMERDADDWAAAQAPAIHARLTAALAAWRAQAGC